MSDVDLISIRFDVISDCSVIIARYSRMRMRTAACVIMAEGGSSLRRGRATSSPIPIERDQEEVYLITVSSGVMMCIDAEYFTEVGAAQRGKR